MTQEQSTFFADFYREHSESLVGYAYRFLHDWEEARVAMQEGFLIGIIKIDKFYSDENPIGWIKKVIQNITSNMYRAQKVRKNRLVPLDGAKIQTAVYDQYEGSNTVIARCKEILTPEEFALFEATIIAGEPSSIVHQDFGLSYEACKRRVSRILQKLRKYWDT